MDQRDNRFYRVMDNEEAAWHEMIDARDAEIELLKKDMERLRDALAPFIQAGKTIAAHPGDYELRIVMLGGLGDACDLMKNDFARLLAAVEE